MSYASFSFSEMACSSIELKPSFTSGGNTKSKSFFVKVKDGGSPHQALNLGEFGSGFLMIVASYFIIQAMIPETLEGLPFGANGVFFATLAGLIADSLLEK